MIPRLTERLTKKKGIKTVEITATLVSEGEDSTCVAATIEREIILSKKKGLRS